MHVSASAGSLWLKACQVERKSHGQPRMLDWRCNMPALTTLITKNKGWSSIAVEIQSHWAAADDHRECTPETLGPSHTTSIKESHAPISQKKLPPR